MSSTSRPKMVHIKIPIRPIGRKQRRWIRHVERLMQLFRQDLYRGAADQDEATVSFAVQLLGELLWDQDAPEPNWDNLDVTELLPGPRSRAFFPDERFAAMTIMFWVTFVTWLANTKRMSPQAANNTIATLKKAGGQAYRDLQTEAEEWMRQQHRSKAGLN